MRRPRLRLIGLALILLLAELLTLHLPIRVSGAGPFAYVTSGTGNLYVIDTSTNAVVKTLSLFTVAVPPNEGGVAVTSNGGRVYVAGGQASDTVVVIDGATNTILTTIPLPVGSAPVGVALSRDGSRVYVADNGGSSVSVIAASSNAVIGTIATAPQPVGVVVSPDSSRLYVSAQGAGGVFQSFDTSTGALLGTVATGPLPGGLAVTPDGSRIYQANQSGQSISVINVAGTPAKITDIADPGGDPTDVAISADGSRAYSSDAQLSVVLVINTATNAVVATIPVGTTPFGVALTPDGSRVYVPAYGGPLSVISTATNTVIATVGGTSQAFGFGAFIQSGAQAPSPTPKPVVVANPLVTLGVTITGCGSITPNTLTTVNPLQAIPVTAVPCPGSVFSGWRGGPCANTRINPCDIAPSGLSTVTAVFTP